MEVPIKVAVRVRPLLTTDHHHDVSCVRVLPGSSQIIIGEEGLFTFDYACPPAYSQQDIYDSTVDELINSFFDGYNATIIAYGQTGAGKTYTMVGPDLSSPVNEAELGIVPRAVRHIFYKIQEMPNRRCIIKCTYVEVYREEVKDLLSMDVYPREIIIREDINGNTVLVGVYELECYTIQDVFVCLETGMAMRHTSTTQMNLESSRSHSVFMLSLEQTWNEGDLLQRKQSKFYFVDLAGSERIQRTGNTGDQLNESISINSGLLALGNVVSALGDPRRKATYVPYRDSKLTRLLKDSLGGTCRTLMICCISPTSSDYDESVSSLKYAKRARNIKNKPVMHSQTFGCIGCTDDQQTGNLNCQPSIQQQVGDDIRNVMHDQLFRLQFASSQWEQLVSNAEQLLHNLQHSGITEELKAQIQNWFCQKEEFRECIKAEGEPVDVDMPIPRTLEVIKELSEPEETQPSDGSSDHSSSIDEYDIDEHIEVFKQQFRDSLEMLIQTVANETDIYDASVVVQTVANSDITKRPEMRRRQSIQHGNQAETDLHKMALALKECQLTSDSEKSDDENAAMVTAECDRSTEIRRLSANTVTCLRRVEMADMDLKKSAQRMQQLQATIRLKEEFIEELLKTGHETLLTKQRYEEKIQQLEAEAQEAKQQLFFTKKALQEFHIKGHSSVKSEQEHLFEMKIEKYQQQIASYERKVSDMEREMLISGGRDRKVDELEASLDAMKQQQQQLQRQLHYEANKKAALEKELQKEMERINVLEQQTEQQQTLLKIQEAALSNPVHSLQAEEIAKKQELLQMKEEHVLQMQKDTEKLRQDLEMQQASFGKMELKHSIDGKKSLTNRGINTEVTHSLHDASCEKDAQVLRREIEQLRHAHDNLVCERQELYDKEPDMNTAQYKRFFEMDEAVDAVDSAIEFKNELICGRKQDMNPSQFLVGRCGENLLELMMMLNLDETRSLLCKYFRKVLDLREDTKKKEVELLDLEACCENRGRDLSHLKRAVRKLDHSFVLQQKEYEEKLARKMGVYQKQCEQRVQASEDKCKALEKEVSHYRLLANKMKKKLKEKNGRLGHADLSVFLDMFINFSEGKSASSAPHQSSHSAIKARTTVPGSENSALTSVKREKNKLIIQQHPRDDRSGARH